MAHHDISRAKYSTLLWIGLVTDTTLAILLVLTLPLIAGMYREPRLTAITFALAALLSLVSLTMQHMALLRRDLRFGVLAVIDFVPPALCLATGIAAARGPDGTTGL